MAGRSLLGKLGLFRQFTLQNTVTLQNTAQHKKGYRPNTLGLMGDEIVHDDMEIEILRHMRFDRVKKGTELACPMTGETAADDTTGRGVEVGKPREGSTALIVVGAPFGLA